MIEPEYAEQREEAVPTWVALFALATLALAAWILLGEAGVVRPWPAYENQSFGLEQQLLDDDPPECPTPITQPV